MTFYATAYTFLSLATFIASVVDWSDRDDMIASAILGLIWPIFLASRIIRKVLD